MCFPENENVLPPGAFTFRSKMRITFRRSDGQRSPERRRRWKSALLTRKTPDGFQIETDKCKSGMTGSTS
jgi:hypothetical protein